VRECGFIEDQGYEAMRAWIAEGDLPEAIFAVNDPVAIGAMHALTEAGYSVGHDLAVVGAGNIHYGDMLSVPLTTVAWSTAEIGQQAARLLIEMIEGDSSSRPPQNVIVAPQLIARRSSSADAKTARARTSR
jgi:LacI family transcriptional regulator